MIRQKNHAANRRHENKDAALPKRPNEQAGAHGTLPAVGICLLLPVQPALLRRVGHSQMVSGGRGGLPPRPLGVHPESVPDETY